VQRGFGFRKILIVLLLALCLTAVVAGTIRCWISSLSRMTTGRLRVAAAGERLRPPVPVAEQAAQEFCSLDLLVGPRCWVT
jgi:hypothetical protein